MKKVIALVLSVLMLASIATLAFSVFAEDVSSKEEPEVTFVIKVNGEKDTKDDVVVTKNDDGSYTITYKGKDNFTKWEIDGATIINGSETSKTITVKINDGVKEVGVNAVTTAAPSGKDGGKTSPKTGAVIAAGVVVMCAGFGAVVTSKKFH